MQRRKLLKSLAASGMAAISIGSVQGRTVPKGQVEGIDTLHVVRDGEKVETVENPTHKQFLELELSLGNDEGLKANDAEYCASYCKENCRDNCEDDYDHCSYECSCSDCKVCCSVSEN